MRRGTQTQHLSQQIAVIRDCRLSAHGARVRTAQPPGLGDRSKRTSSSMTRGCRLRRAHHRRRQALSKNLRRILTSQIEAELRRVPDRDDLADAARLAPLALAEPRATDSDCWRRGAAAPGGINTARAMSRERYPILFGRLDKYRRLRKAYRRNGKATAVHQVRFS